LVNLRKEILPFIPNAQVTPQANAAASEDCSDVLVVNDSMATLTHNEDGNVALAEHT